MRQINWRWRAWLTICKKGEFHDSLITDLFMPERDGFETMKYFRARNPGMLIVAISGWQSTQSADHLAVALHAGADAILRKPFSPVELLDKLRDCVLGSPAAA